VQRAIRPLILFRALVKILHFCILAHLICARPAKIKAGNSQIYHRQSRHENPPLYKYLRKRINITVVAFKASPTRPKKGKLTCPTINSQSHLQPRFFLPDTTNTPICSLHNQGAQIHNFKLSSLLSALFKSTSHETQCLPKSPTKSPPCPQAPPTSPSNSSPQKRKWVPRIYAPVSTACHELYVPYS
jgi:hypothetical protein